ARARPQPPGGAGQACPRPYLLPFEEEQLDLAPGPHLLADQSRRDHLGVVEHQKIVGAEKRWKVAKGVVRDAPRRSVEMQKPRRVPGRDGRLLDLRFGELIIEI